MFVVDKLVACSDVARGCFIVTHRILFSRLLGESWIILAGAETRYSAQQGNKTGGRIHTWDESLFRM